MSRQSGSTLIVVLLLLVVATLLGLASMRGVLLEERMSSNLYDRSVAFQSAERALRMAENALNSAVEPGNVVNCESVKNSDGCKLPDAKSGNIANVVWTTVPDLSNKTTGLEAGKPQYVIQRMQKTDSNAQYGADRNAANQNEQPDGSNVAVQANYRIFARSHDPSSSDSIQGRAVVVLQSNVVLK